MRAPVSQDPAREDDVTHQRGVGRMACREDQLLVSRVVQDPNVGGWDDLFLVDLVAEATPPRTHGDDVAPTEKVDVQERMRVRHTVSCESRRAGLAGEGGARVMARTECKHRGGDTLASGLVEVEPWDRQGRNRRAEAEPGRHRLDVSAGRPGDGSDAGKQSRK